MVSEPTDCDAPDAGRSPSVDTAEVPAEVPAEVLAAAPEPQPRWMSVSVALVGIIGLAVMIYLVRG